MRILVVGGGILGIAAAHTVLGADQSAEVTVLEKEHDVARHQTGHNSGVVHAGLYYAPGSLKARLCRRGAGLLRGYCATQGIDYVECGKVLVATTEEELDRLDRVQERAQANGVPGVRRLGGTELRVLEPHASGLGALHSPSTAIVDFAAVTRALRDEAVARGATVRLDTTVARVHDEGQRPEVVLATGETLRADRVLVCAGLHADRLARASGRPSDPRIIPFRGQYYALRPGRSALVRGLIYPVPDPGLPFLGVHLTRTVHGSVLVGPNAVLALAREGYRRSDVSLGDIRDIAGWSGMRGLARRHWRAGLAEIARSASRRAFIREARRYVPEIAPQDVIPAPAGVRAQAVSAAGELLDDFVLDRGRHVVWVRNAPSPAATSALAIAEELAERLGVAGTR